MLSLPPDLSLTVETDVATKVPQPGQIRKIYREYMKVCHSQGPLQEGGRIAPCFTNGNPLRPQLRKVCRRSPPSQVSGEMSNKRLEPAYLAGTLTRNDSDCFTRRAEITMPARLRRNCCKSVLAGAWLTASPAHSADGSGSAACASLRAKWTALSYRAPQAANSISTSGGEAARRPSAHSALS